jgi:hypothetical protein
VLLMALTLVGLGSVAGPVAEAAPRLAPAHNKNSLIDVTVVAAPGGVRVQADVRYDDGDPVVDEDVLGLARESSSRETTRLKFRATGTEGQYVTDIAIEDGEWDIEVDAVTYTRGVRTVHFALSGSGEVSNLTFVAPLPNGIERPTTPRKGVGTILMWAVVVAFGALIVYVVVELRRRAKAVDA